MAVFSKIINLYEYIKDHICLYFAILWFYLVVVLIFLRLSNWLGLVELNIFYCYIFGFSVFLVLYFLTFFNPFIVHFLARISFLNVYFINYILWCRSVVYRVINTYPKLSLVFFQNYLVIIYIFVFFSVLQLHNPVFNTLFFIVYLFRSLLLVPLFFSSLVYSHHRFKDLVVSSTSKNSTFSMTGLEELAKTAATDGPMIAKQVEELGKQNPKTAAAGLVIAVVGAGAAVILAHKEQSTKGAFQNDQRMNDLISQNHQVHDQLLRTNPEYSAAHFSRLRTANFFDKNAPSFAASEFFRVKNGESTAYQQHTEYYHTQKQILINTTKLEYSLDASPEKLDNSGQTNVNLPNANSTPTPKEFSIIDLVLF